MAVQRQNKRQKAFNPKKLAESNVINYQLSQLKFEEVQTTTVT